MPKTYSQTCAVARGLEVLGGRWTLLIVRELLIGPRRFTDIEANLPGIPSSLLGNRLRELETAGLVRKRQLPRPAPSVVYELTDAGQALDEVVLAIGRWGSLYARRAAAEDATRPEWQLVALKGAFRPEAAAKVERTFEMRFRDHVVAAEVRRGRLKLSETSAVAPDLVLSTEFRTFMELVTGRLALADARRSGLVALEGETNGDAELLLQLFSVRPTEASVDW